MKHVLVTGGAGFIGSNFCNTHKDLYRIVALDNFLLGTPDNLDPEIPLIEGDACEKADLEKALAVLDGKVDVIVHFAGSSSAPMFTDDFVSSYENSTKSFLQVLDFAAEKGVTKVLYASTSSLYGNNPLPLTEDQQVTPQNHYAVTKFFYEHASRCFTALHPEVETIGFRFMSVYGPNEEAKGKYANIISQFAWDIAREKSPVIYGDGEQFRDFTHVSDVIAALQLAIDAKEQLGAEVFNIGTGETCTLNEIVKALEKAFGKSANAEYIENPVKEVYIKGQCAEISKIQKKLGFAPKVKLEDGIQNQVAQLRMDKIRETSSDALR